MKPADDQTSAVYAEQVGAHRPRTDIRAIAIRWQGLRDTVEEV